MSRALRVLIVEDSADDAQLLLCELRAGGFDATAERVETAETMRAALDREAWDIVISDYQMPRFSGLAALKLLRVHGRDLPFILVSGTVGEELAVEAMQAGADDYVMKDKLARLVPAVERELREAAGRRERRRVEAEFIASEARYRRLFESARDGIVILNADTGTVVDVNPFLIELLRVPREHLVGKKFWEAAGFRAIAADAAGFAALRARSYVRFDNQSLTAADGRRIDVEFVSTVYPVDHHTVMQCSIRDITERKQAQEAQKSQLKFLETLIDTIPSSVFYKNAEGVYLGCNKIWADQVMGMPKEQIIGRTVFQLPAAIPPDLAKIYDDKDQWLLGHPGVQSYESEVQCADRVRRTFVFTKATFGSADRPVAGIVGVMLDITARQQAEEALRRSEERFRNLAENTSDWIWEANEQGVYTYASPHVRDLLGYEPAEVLGRTPFEFMSPEEAARVQPSFMALVARREPLVVLENVNLRKDGRRVVLETSAVPIYDSAGGWRGYRGIDRDVTERKATERRLREQNEIISNSREGVMIVNLDNTVSFWNRGAEAMFGWTAAEALGREADQLFGVDGLAVGATARAAVEREGFWNGEMRAQTRDGRRLILDCRMSLVRDDAGRPRARLSFLSDITEKKLLEEKFLHAQRLESIGMLAAGIAHDLNNVLAPIVFAGPLLRESLSAERDLKILNSLEQSAARGAGLVKQILSFAHSTTGELRPTQVKHLARDIANLIEETFPKSIRLDQQIPANLWLVQGNPTQIHQVLLNLCVNARDAMPQGGTLRLVAENRRLDEAEARTLPEGRPGAWLVIEVADTGTGIPPDVLAHIWEPFFTTKGAGKGTGLGLSTVRGIVASHHGFVTLDTQVGHGTTFRVFLPATEEKTVSGGTAPVFAAPAGHDELILVVDDDTAILETIATILTQHHYRVLCASDGVEAVSHFTAHPTEIALAITDVDMPLLSGTALARILSQLRSDLPLLVMSGLTGEENGGSRSQIAEAKRLSPAFIHKPFTPETLLVAVHKLLHPAGKA